ncbi:MAG TPA: SGNH/GDSL hydrolase family protein [Verrucomicrobiae bacterium]|nr:SGNH/GDSL hydrolase family protein [Verrucomicrobiae bacterium]
MLRVGGIILCFLLIVWSAKVIVLALSVNRYAAHWRQTAGLPQENQIRYIALGDSTAQAIGASKPTKGYVGLVAGALSQKHKASVHVTNISVSGATVRDALEKQLPQLQYMLTTPATVLTIEIGANDMKNYHQQEFGSQIDQLFSQLPKQTVVSTIPYFGHGRYWRLEKNVRPANAIIEKAAKHYGLRVAPLYDVTKQRDNPLVYAADYFHPSNRGYRNWFDAFWLILDS